MEKVTFPLPEEADRFYYVVWFQQSRQKGLGNLRGLESWKLMQISLQVPLFYCFHLRKIEDLGIWLGTRRTPAIKTGNWFFAELLRGHPLWEQHGERSFDFFSWGREREKVYICIRRRGMVCGVWIVLWGIYILWIYMWEKEYNIFFLCALERGSWQLWDLMYHVMLAAGSSFLLKITMGLILIFPNHIMNMPCPHNVAFTHPYSCLR